MRKSNKNVPIARNSKSFKKKSVPKPQAATKKTISSGTPSSTGNSSSNNVNSTAGKKNETKKNVSSQGSSELSNQLNILKSVVPGSEEFRKALKEVDRLIFSTNQSNVVIEEKDYENIYELYKECKHIMLFENPALLGFKLNLADKETLESLLNKVRGEYPVFESMSNEFHKMTIPKLLKSMGDEDKAYNLLSLEVSKMKMFDNKIKLPCFVIGNSFIERLETSLEVQLYLNKKLLRKTVNGAERTALLQKNKILRRLQKKIPYYKNYVICTSANATVNFHVDMSATGVYYYVHKGVKVFYAAPATEENIEWYKKFGHKIPNFWELNEEDLKRFQRIEVRAGQMIFMSPGVIHYVYTPEKSIVVGGNFMTELHLPLHFSMTRFEEKSQSEKKHKFISFTDWMYAYTKYTFLNTIKYVTMRRTEEKKTPAYIEKHGRQLLEGLKQMENPIKGSNSFSVQNKQEIRDELEERLKQNMVVLKAVRAAQAALKRNAANELAVNKKLKKC